MSFEKESDFKKINTRKEIIETELKNFEAEVFAKFPEEDAKKIKTALEFMLKIHLPQNDRADGRPFASHPLAVAEKIMKMSDNPELVISALIHDSVEDQADQIFIERINRKNLGGGLKINIDETLKEKYKSIFASWSFKEIEDRFGSKVKYYTENMTNHDYNSLAENLNLEDEEKEKFINKLYAEHIDSIMNDPDLLTLKLADLSTNIDLHSLSPDSEKYRKLKRKYKSVIEAVINKLSNISSGLPIHTQKDEIIEELTKVYEEQYK
ncbi:MAG: hypothetical protein ACOYL8_01505 [Patescibacteria group bacterium]